MSIRLSYIKSVMVCLATTAACISTAVCANASVNVVTATPELADIAKSVGGNRISVYSVAKPNRDYHRVDARPSDVSRVAHANLVIRVGLDLDMWMDALLNASGNRSVTRGGRGYVDASVGVKRLEVPHGQITGASGDIHVEGNPHYFYDPDNGIVIARNVLEGLVRVDPSGKSAYESNYEQFAKEIHRRVTSWEKELAPFKGHRVVTYHQSATYFLRRFGLVLGGTIEVKPGIPPSASHVAELVRTMKEQHTQAVVIESVYPTRFPELVTRETGVKYQVVPYSVGSDSVHNYFELIDAWVSKYKAALR